VLKERSEFVVETSVCTSEKHFMHSTELNTINYAAQNMLIFGSRLVVILDGYIVALIHLGYVCRTEKIKFYNILNMLEIYCAIQWLKKYEAVKYKHKLCPNNN
jgi:hypothetical protein